MARKRGIDRKRHLTGRLAPIPYRVAVRLFKGTKRLKSGCWIPALPKLRNGYPVLYWHDHTGTDRTLTAVHAMARIMFREGEPLDDGEQPHHKCINRACVNPDHLSVVSADLHHWLHWDLRRRA